MKKKANTKRSTRETDRQKESGNELVFSYKTIRNIIGYSGMLLPVILALFSLKEQDSLYVEPSISEYYYSSNGDVFVAILCVISAMLFTYYGYNFKEKIWITLASLSGLGVAFCATDNDKPNYAHSVHSYDNGVPEIFGAEWHMIFAVIFFISLSVMCLYYFPMSSEPLIRKPGEKRTSKEIRNIVFRICGWTMIACITIIGAYFLFKPVKNAFGDFQVIFVFETIAIWAFGFSWLTKGETFWPDGEHYLKSAYKEIRKSL
ncbi:MAG: hypothetical protein K8I03_07280 [Ignavibacteria bacterium]|nr:hypothetical protein [Ignavibacteria bacterium]